MMSSLRLTALVSGLMLFVAACSGGGGNGGVQTSAGEHAGDRTLGSADAAITFTEYASVACSHCANFHERVWPTLEQDYIETGQVRFIFREMIAGPPQIAMAGFALAHCVADDRYFDAISLLFQQQGAIFQAMQSGGARAQYVAIARSLGLSETQLNACLNDTAITEAIVAANEQANADGVGRTPTFFIDGVLLLGGRTEGETGEVWYLGGELLEDAEGAIPASHSAESIARALDAAIARKAAG